MPRLSQPWLRNTRSYKGFPRTRPRRPCHLLSPKVEPGRLYDLIVERSQKFLESFYGYDEAGFRRLLWREVIPGQMDADRMDYLLRDSLHTGVDYGKYDWRGFLNTVQAVEMAQSVEETHTRASGLE